MNVDVIPLDNYHEGLLVAAAAPDELAPELDELQEAISVYSAQAEKWRLYALRLEAFMEHHGLQMPGPLLEPCNPARSSLIADSARLEWLEQRIREIGPDVGYLLGLPQGWKNLRFAIDQALHQKAAL